MDKIRSFINFEDYKVEEIIFILNHSFIPKEEVTFNPKFSVSHNYLNNESDVVKVTLTCEISDKEFYGGEHPFYLKIIVNGYFEVVVDYEKEVDNELLKEVLNVNTVAILFPYLRSIITTITAAVNIPPLILPPVNINKLLNQSN